MQGGGGSEVLPVSPVVVVVVVVDPDPEVVAVTAVVDPAVASVVTSEPASLPLAPFDVPGPELVGVTSVVPAVVPEVVSSSEVTPVAPVEPPPGVPHADSSAVTHTERARTGQRVMCATLSRSPSTDLYTCTKSTGPR